jgi:hypothetical protein
MGDACELVVSRMPAVEMRLMAPQFGGSAEKGGYWHAGAPEGRVAVADLIFTVRLSSSAVPPRPPARPRYATI